MADAVAAVALGGESAASTTSSASSTSVRRWSAWIAALADVAMLHAVAAQVDPSTATVATPTPRSLTAGVLDALEVLGAALVRTGVVLVERTGLGRVLGWQHRAHDDVLGLVVGPRRFSRRLRPEVARTVGSVFGDGRRPRRRSRARSRVGSLSPDRRGCGGTARRTHRAVKARREQGGHVARRTRGARHRPHAPALARSRFVPRDMTR